VTCHSATTLHVVATINWRVVFDDGTRPLSPGIRPDQRRPLYLIAGEDTEITVTLTDPSGGLVQLGDTEFLLMDARTTAARPVQLFSARSTQSIDVQRIAVAGDTTKLIFPQRAVFDLWAIRATGRSNLIPLSELVIAASALGNNYL
jgi:hypothetical protein